VSREPTRPDLGTVASAAGVTVTGRDVLFVHRRVDEAIADVVPDPLKIHRIDGDPWVSVLAQEITETAPRGLSLPVVPAFPQLNVRTYVEYEGEVGVYFLRLLTGSDLGTELGRRVFGLPFETGALSFSRRDGRFTFRSRATGGREQLRFDARYGPTGSPSSVEPGTPVEELTERHRFYVPGATSGGMFTGVISRDPWQVASCSADVRTDTVCQVLGVDPVGDSIVRYSPGYESELSNISRMENPPD
jgi:uncharacterized protein YqjF (DUF2071 family)